MAVLRNLLENFFGRAWGYLHAVTLTMSLYLQYLLWTAFLAMLDIWSQLCIWKDGYNAPSAEKSSNSFSDHKLHQAVSSDVLDSNVDISGSDRTSCYTDWADTSCGFKCSDMSRSTPVLGSPTYKNKNTLTRNIPSSSPLPYSDRVPSNSDATVEDISLLLRSRNVVLSKPRSRLEWRITKALGRGGNGRVFEGIPLSSGPSERPVAIKVLSKVGNKSKGDLNYIWDEIWYMQVCTASGSPLLVQLEWYFEDADNVYIGMPVYARSLPALIRDGLSEHDRRIRAAEMVHAVSDLHSLGIMHRDIKPENFMLTRDNHIVLIDLGLACLLHTDLSSNRSYHRVGTAGYTAPEVLRQTAYDEKADIWGLGMVMLEMAIDEDHGFFETQLRERYKRRADDEEMCDAVLGPDDEGSLELAAAIQCIFDDDLRDLLQKMLHYSAMMRITLENIRGHVYFKDIDWEADWSYTCFKGGQMLCS